jgi:hypothetical protein
MNYQDGTSNNTAGIGLVGGAFGGGQLSNTLAAQQNEMDRISRLQYYQMVGAMNKNDYEQFEKHLVYKKLTFLESLKKEIHDWHGSLLLPE